MSCCSQPDTVPLWDGTVGPSPPQPMFDCSLGERRAHCFEELRRLNKLIEAWTHGDDQEFLGRALVLRARLLLWLYQYCNIFEVSDSELLRNQISA